MGDMPDKIWACVDNNQGAHWVEKYPVYGGSTKYTRTELINKGLDEVIEGLDQAVGLIKLTNDVQEPCRYAFDAQTILMEEMKKLKEMRNNNGQ